MLLSRRGRDYIFLPLYSLCIYSEKANKAREAQSAQRPRMDLYKFHLGTYIYDAYAYIMSLSGIERGIS